MVTIEISPKFLAQLEEICFYLAANRSAEFSQEFQEEIFVEIERILPFPRRWQQVNIPAVPGEFRRILHGVYQIFYEIDAGRIMIHAIVDGRRRPPLFQPD
ncbi:MAG: type II toxin-antitoxin system RelE/ParE family toxin [bacterium]